MGLVGLMATRDEAWIRQTNQTRHCNAGFHKRYCISYPSICTAMDRLSCSVHY